MSRIADYAKFVTEIAVALGTTKITNDIIRNNVEVETTTQKVTVGAASFAIGGAVADAASKHTDRCIDAVDEFVADILDKTKTDEN